MLTRGDTTVLTAIARDSGGQAIPGTPRIWTSLDPAVVMVVDKTGRAASAAEAGGGRGEARLVTGQADTAMLVVEG